MKFKLSVICSADGVTENFVRSLFSGSSGIQLLLVGDKAEEICETRDENSIEYIKSQDGILAAFNSAIAKVDSDLVLFALPDTVFAPEFSKAVDGAAVFNVAKSDKNGSCRLYRSGFNAYETFTPAVGVNFVMRTDVIKAHSISLESADALGFAAFAAKYAAYDSFSTIDEVLLYGVESAKVSAENFEKMCIAVLPDGGLSALGLLLWSYSELSNADKENCFAAFSESVKPFCENELYCAYALAAFGADLKLIEDGCRASDFVLSGTNVLYKEVTLPILADAVVRDFYGGKLSFGTLRRCVAAWLYFKLYRMGGAAAKIGCKVCRKLAGGELNV